MTTIEFDDKLYQVTSKQVREMFDVLKVQASSWADSYERGQAEARRDIVLDAILHQRIVEEDND